MNYKQLVSNIIILLLIIPAAVAQPVSETRTVYRSFAVNDEMSLQIINKYGKVHLSKSADDSVHIKIEMNAIARNTSKLRNLTDGISFNLSSTNYFIFAETDFNRGPVNFLESLRNLTNNLISSESKVEIDYYASVPENIDVKIDNRYGDIYLESTGCNLDINHSNGSLKAEQLSGDNYFRLNFSDAAFKSLNNAKIDADYSDMRIDYADDLTVKSVSTKLYAETIIRLDTDSKRDRYEIDKISRLNAISYFSSFNIYSLYNTLQCSTRYGSIDVREMDHGFELLSVESSYTDVRIVSPEGASFSLDLKLDNCPAVIPSEWQLEETVLGNDNNEYLYFGIIGNGDNNSRMILNMNKGNLSLY